MAVHKNIQMGRINGAQPVIEFRGILSIRLRNQDMSQVNIPQITDTPHLADSGKESTDSTE